MENPGDTTASALGRLRSTAIALGDKLLRNSTAKVDDEARELEAAAVAYARAVRDEARMAAGLAELLEARPQRRDPKTLRWSEDG